MFEQPMKAADLDGLARLQQAVTTPVCLDESAETHEQTAEAIRRGACRIVNLKIQRVGGLGPARAIHDLCHQHGIACWVGSMPELGIGQAFGIHLATLANCKYPTDVEPSARWFVDDYVVPALELVGAGSFQRPRSTRCGVPGRPGQGPPLPGPPGGVHLPDHRPGVRLPADTGQAGKPDLQVDDIDQH